MQKDGEVVVTGDFIYRIIHFHMPWRAGKIYVLNEIQTQNMLKHDPDWLMLNMQPTRVIEPIVAVNSYHVKELVELADGKVNPTSYFHYAYAAPTAIFSKIGGYDEDYKTYGWEDADMYCRLFHNEVYLVPDSGCAAIHPFHPRAADCTSENLLKMRQLFVNKSPADYFRNKTHAWGQGT